MVIFEHIFSSIHSTILTLVKFIIKKWEQIILPLKYIWITPKKFSWDNANHIDYIVGKFKMQPI